MWLIVVEGPAPELAEQHQDAHQEKHEADDPEVV
jgi:hypothetical protein